MSQASAPVIAQCTRVPARVALRLERFEVEVEVRQRMIANVAPGTPQRLELGKRRLDPRAAGDEAGRNVGERRLQRRIGERGGDARLEGGRPLHGAPRDAAWAIGGSPISPASTSATCRQATGEPCRDSLPATFIRQPSSPDSTSSGADAIDVGRLCRDHGVGDVGELHREQPAEAAASFGAGHLDQLQALHGGEQAARLLLDLELAQARAAVVIGDAAGEACPAPTTCRARRRGTRQARARARRTRARAARHPSSPDIRRG